MYYDVLNILACFAVLCLHHNGIVHWYNVNTLAWKQALAFEVIFFWAVPVFFMLTGATLMPYKEHCSTKMFFERRIKRALVPFIAWSSILLLFDWYKKSITVNSVADCISLVINTKLKYAEVYWFFIPLFAIYLTMPVLSVFNSDK